MSDIFEIARTYGDADYYDFNTGKTYLIQKWNRMKNGEEEVVVPGIPIMEPDGTISSYVPDPELMDKYNAIQEEEPEVIWYSFEELENDHTREGLVGKSFICNDGTEFDIDGIDTTGYVNYLVNWKKTSGNIAGYLSEMSADNEDWYGCGTLADLVGCAHGARLAD